MTVGPMYSGKTNKLIYLYKQEPNKNKIAIDFSIDGSDKFITSHDNLKIPCIKSKTLLDLDVSNYDIIYINEYQFFEDILEFVSKYLSNDNKEIYIFGLDGDFMRNPFEVTNKLLALSNNIVKLNGKCSCGNHSIFSKRLNDNNERILYDPTCYKSVCRKCYDK